MLCKGAVSGSGSMLITRVLANVVRVVARVTLVCAAIGLVSLAIAVVSAAVALIGVAVALRGLLASPLCPFVRAHEVLLLSWCHRFMGLTELNDRATDNR
jgi:high-affinity Fe2+/Pb2+ permease